MMLSNATIDQISAEISRPTYERSSLSAGIVHIGVGNFHRAHQAWYLHRLMQMGEAEDWGIIGAGVRAADAEMRTRLKSQDCLTTLIELNPDGTSAEVVGSMIDYLPVEDGNGALIEQLADPGIRIVSLTVTEGGYYIDPVSKEFDPHHPDIKHDAANPAQPKTAFGAIVAALRIRRDKNLGPFTGLSCDNLPGNGNILRQTVVSLAAMTDRSLADWIEANCTFPNSMVDCIVPATGPAELELSRQMGVADQAPVTHENFRQWVMEDRFCAGRPAWEKSGATFTGDVHAYEMMKLRILNAGHQIIANPGEILGLETVADCMADQHISAYFNKVELSEIVPHVAGVPEMVPEDYVELIKRRFANPAIKDTTRRVAFDGSSRHTGFVLPLIRAGLADGVPIAGLALSEALWARMCAGTREDGNIIEPNDPFWADLNKCALRSATHAGDWLNQRHIYGHLADNEKFASAFTSWLEMIWTDGCRSALQHYIEP